jgi:hypothetical protein
MPHYRCLGKSLKHKVRLYIYTKSHCYMNDWLPIICPQILTWNYTTLLLVCRLQQLQISMYITLIHSTLMKWYTFIELWFVLDRYLCPC